MFPTQLLLKDGEEKKTSVAFATNVLEDGRETPILLAEQPAKPQTGVGQHVSCSVCQSHVSGVFAFVVGANFSMEISRSCERW